MTPGQERKNWGQDRLSKPQHVSRRFIPTNSLEVLPGGPCHQSLARSFGAGRHPVQDIGGKGDYGSPVAHSGLDLVAGTKLQVTAFIVRRIGELHRNRKLTPRLYISLVHMPVVMAILAAVINGILERFGKSAE